ncbi:MAG: SprT-like domain-containing protein [Pseudomonadota bacterium]
MKYVDLKIALDNTTNHARRLGYEVATPELSLDSVFGSKLAYYQHGRNKIVFHDHFVENASDDEIMQTVIHELAHAIAEQNNTLKKAVWHGQAWKDINAKLGGNASRYHIGGYSKPAPKKMSMAELFAIQPTKPADEWERGTFNQWLRRGYHVMKGQKGQLSVWTFIGDEYETGTDGQTGKAGKASAVYFTPDQVEANKPAVKA